MLVTKQAPDFKGQAVMPDGSFKEIKLADYAGKKIVLFFYPLDFTMVCPTELVAFDNRIAEFEKRNTVVIGCSIDSHYSHLAWRNTPRDKGGIGAIHYPLLADLSKGIAKAYDVLLGRDEFGNGGTIALRGSFLIDEKGVIRHALVNDLPLGRNIDEMLRMIDALDFHSKHGEVCPAGWSQGKPAMKANIDGMVDYLKNHSKNL